MTKYVCSIYEDRPETCRGYPWNFANSMFPDCIFIDETESPMRLRTIEEQLKLNTMKEISEYCVGCGKCCFFGPAACSKLLIIEEGEDEPTS